MKRITKNKIFTCLVAAVFALLAAVFAIFSFSDTFFAEAYTTAKMPTAANVIGNLYDGDNAFNLDNLNALAKRLKKADSVTPYSGMKELINDVRDNNVTRNASDFGSIVVNFGSYTFGNNDETELAWIPAYVSNSKQGPILTLWLASTSNTNTAATSNQEVSSWSDGTEKNTAAGTLTFTEPTTGEEVKVYSNTYDGSYIRNYVLNVRSKYAKNFGSGTSVTPPNADTMTKYVQFTGSGELSDFLVEPKNVSWQTEAGYMKNDPKYTLESNYPCNWVNDKIWIPSVYEVFDGSLTLNSTKFATASESDGGLWGTTVDMRSNNIHTHLRNGHPGTYHQNSDLYNTGSATNAAIYRPWCVRPALHLNLTKALAAAHQHEFTESLHHQASSPTCTSSGNPEYWQCASCERYYADNEGVTELFTKDLTIAIDPTAHVLDKQELLSATCTDEGYYEHYKCTQCKVLFWDNAGNSTCTLTDVTIPSLQHDMKDTVTAPTCTEQGYTTHSCKRENCDYSFIDTYVSMLGHDWSDWEQTKAPTESEEGEEERECFRDGCGATESQTIAKLNHTHKFAEDWTSDETDHWHASTCGHNITEGKASHIWNDGEETTPASCTAEGKKTFTCTVCGKKRTESIEKIAHDIEHHEAQAPNCTEVGWNAYDTCSRCDYTTKTEITALGHDWADEWSKDEINHWHECSRCDEINDEAAHTHEWVITTPATTEADGLMENLCAECGHKDGEEVIAKLDDGNGNEIDLPVDINNVEFKVTQSSTDNDYSNIDHNLKRGYWAQLWYRNQDGTLGDEFTDQMNCFLTLKIPTEVIEAIRRGEEINRDKIAEGLKVYYIDEAGTHVEVENFAIAMRDDDSWQIKFNYNEKFRAEVVFAADVEVQPTAEPKAGIPWWVWLLVVIGCLTVVGVVIVIIVVAKKKNGNTTVVQSTNYDDAHIREHLSEQDKKLDEIREIVDGGFNDTMDE